MVRRAGLDVSAIKVSELINRRIDAECYRIEFLQLDTWQDFYSLKDLCLIRSGTTPPDRDDELKDGVILLKTTDIRNNVLSREDSSNFYYISKEISERMNNTLLQPKDVLINIVGATTDVIGRVAYVPEGFPESNITQAMAFLRVTDPRLNPAFLFSFLSSEYGNKQVRRYARPTGQYNLNLQEVSNFKVPLPPKDFQRKIEKLVITADVKLGESKQLYADAEKLLASELGLDRLDLSESLFNVRNVSDVLKSKRLDAEHFRQKYYRVIKAMERLKPKSISTLGDLTETLTNGHTPLHHDLDTGDTSFFTAEHVYDFRLDHDNARLIWKENHEVELKRTQLRNNDVLITIKGRVGNAAVVYDLPTETNINQDVALLRLKSGIHPWYVAGFLNSPAGKALMEQIATGQINPFLGLGNLTQIQIPIFDEKRMNELGEKIRKTVEKAEDARQEAKRLLAEAKSAVELLIENG